eukprot:gnl/MRDRNA2_/MRDRNA2_93097_c0_seq1.p1 gnl/MRDRNA2_/MRDRNA2_93097_c0~~gnl/MRDRNA2_/MRDRNA2_93097_c0_seq1.p1  ORF type:complete len:275 (+),score=85.11 gnl/MRDRNA2_/MRDRNA2_93097_c0_seq1:96-920(+)
MQALLLSLFIYGAGAATLHDLSDRLAIPPGDRTPINQVQVNEVMRAESAALPELQTALAGLQKMNDQAEATITKKSAFLEKKADVTKPKKMETDLDKTQDVKKTTEETKEIEEVTEEAKHKKGGKAHGKSRGEPDQKEKKAEIEGEAITGGVVEPKKARDAEQKGIESADGWDITFFVLLTACVFVFGWWAIKLGWHERAAEASKEFAFQCKKALSSLLKAPTHGKMLDEKSESSYEASEGTSGSDSSKGALNSHLQGVIDRVKGNLDAEQQKK